MRQLQVTQPSVGDVRGIGLFWAIELTKDRGRRLPFNTRKEKAAGQPLVVNVVVAEALRHGVSVVGWINHLIIAPPLIVTEAELAEGVAGLDEALKVSDDLVTARD